MGAAAERRADENPRRKATRGCCAKGVRWCPVAGVGGAGLLSGWTSKRPESRERWSGGLVFEGVVGKPRTAKVDPARLYGLGVRQWVMTFAKCPEAEAARTRRVACTG